MTGFPIDYDPSLANFDVGDIGLCEKSWAEVKVSGKSPRGRASHTATALDYFRFVVIGGGACSPSGLWVHFGDAHVFDARGGAWQELALQADAEHGSFPPRRGHVASHWPSELVLVFGGTAGGVGLEGMLNDSWVLDVATSAWQKLETSGSTPAPRRGAVSCCSRGFFLVVGGYTEALDRDVYLLDTATTVWTTATTRGDPVPIFALAGSAAGGSSLYVFGGSPNAGFFRLRMRSETETRKAPHSNPASTTEQASAPLVEVAWYSLRGQVPSRRFCHGMALLADRWILVFGGTEDPQNTDESTSSEMHTLNDCFMMDLFHRGANSSALALCRQVVPRGLSGPKIRNGFSMVSLGTKLVVYGGGIYPEVYYNDTWVLDLHLQPDVSITPDMPGANLGADFGWLLESDEGLSLSDVVVNVGGATASCRYFPAHRAVLCSRSDYFRALLVGGFAEALQGQVSLPSCNPAAFETVLLYMYTGRLALPPHQIEQQVDEIAVDLDLLQAVKRGNLAAATHALSCGADPNFLDSTTGLRVVHLPCMPGVPEDVSGQIVTLLWTANADFSIAAANGATPARLAAAHGRKVVMAALVKALRETPCFSINEVYDEAPDDWKSLLEDSSLEPALHVLDIADQLGLTHLCLLCEQWLARALRRASIFDLLRISDEFHCMQLRLICLHYFKRHRHCCKAAAFKSLPKELREEIVWSCQGV